MYHIELRQFPHNLNRFNLDSRGIGEVVTPWVREEFFEQGDRKWSSQLATIKILEGPHIPVEELSMGRGWRTAEREGEDVTEQILASARQALGVEPADSGPVWMPAAPGEEAPPPPVAVAASDSADPLTSGVALAQLLGREPERLLRAWRDVVAGTSGLSPSEGLALAERRIADG